MKKKRSVLKRKMDLEDVIKFHLFPGELRVLRFLALADFGRTEEMSLATGVSKATLEKKYIPELRNLGLLNKYSSKKIERRLKKKIELYYLSQTGAARLVTEFYKPDYVNEILLPGCFYEEDDHYMPPPNTETDPTAKLKHKLLTGRVVAYLMRKKRLIAGQDAKNMRKFESETKEIAPKVIPDLYVYMDSFSDVYPTDQDQIEFWEIETNQNDTQRLEQKIKKYEDSEESLLEFFKKERMILVFALKAEKKERWMVKFNKAIKNLHYKEFSKPTFEIRFVFLTEDFVNSYEERYEEQDF